MVPTDLATATADVRRRIDEAATRAGRPWGADDPGTRLQAASKYLEPDELPVLVEAGVLLFGENRRDQLEAKQQAVRQRCPDAEVEWHFIGRLQSRAVPWIAPRVDCIQTLASESAARALARVPAADRPRVLVQVNVDADQAKAGVPADELVTFLEALPDALQVEGLMTMPAATLVPEASRPAFRALRELRDRLRPRFSGRHPLVELSMGTSQDYEVAVEEGATIVRLGRVLGVGGRIPGVG